MAKRIAVLALVLLAAACTVPGVEAQAGAGQVVADSGFRPKPHGFAFQNWGGKQYPQSQLTADDAAYLFGDQVCARREGESCVPTPAARMWLAEMNRATEGGHCEGMAALSAAFYVKAEKPDDYGARQAFELTPQDGALLRTISTYFSTQALEPVQSTTSATRGWTLQQIVDHLSQALKAGNDYPTLGLYGDDGGHAITPYKIESQGNGRYRIHVYDNNYPGAEKYVEVDTANDRWTYGGAALNPSEDPAPWKGGAGSMDVTLLSDRYQPLQCPFCGKPQARPAAAQGSKPAPQAAKPKPRPQGAQASRPAPPRPQVSKKPRPATAQAAAPRPQSRPARKPATAAQGYAVITPSRCTQVQAVGKANKQQIRMGKAGTQSQIAGASMRPMRGSRGCVVRLPAGQEYDVRLIDDGKPASRPLTGVTVFSPGRVYSVSDVAIRPGAAQTVRLGQSAFTYRAGGGDQQPTVRVGGGNESGNSFYEVRGLTIAEGYNFRAGEDESGRVSFSGDDPGLEAFDLEVEVVGEEDSVVYDYEDVEVSEDGQVLLAIDDDGEVEMEFDDVSEDEVEDFGTEEEYDALLEDEETDEAFDEAEDAGDEDASEDDSDEGADEDAEDEAYEGEEEAAEDEAYEGEQEAAADEAYEGEQEAAEDEAYEGEEEAAEDEAYEGEEDAAEDESYEDGDEESEDESYEDEDEDEGP